MVIKIDLLPCSENALLRLQPLSRPSQLSSCFTVILGFGCGIRTNQETRENLQETALTIRKKKIEKLLKPSSTLSVSFLQSSRSYLLHKIKQI